MVETSDEMLRQYAKSYADKLESITREGGGKKLSNWLLIGLLEGMSEGKVQIGDHLLHKTIMDGLDGDPEQINLLCRYIASSGLLSAKRGYVNRLSNA